MGGDRGKKEEGYGQGREVFIGGSRAVPLN